MNKDLVLYRNELKNKIVPKYKLIGIVNEIIFSKELFKRNYEIVIFLNVVFNINYKSYVIKSRTMIAARTSRIIHCAEEQEYVSYKENLLRYINKAIQTLDNDGEKTVKNLFDGWINKK
ncbi:MAG: hypothetical protein PHD70_14470 [Anaerostipes sp.]|nr:hypothetical protein [Anaerostipes sp.]MDD3747661.1 hypothetical protein [Anaerostipes sp.]